MSDAMRNISEYWSGWAVDAIATATQNRRLLEDDKEYDHILTEAIKANTRKAITNALEHAGRGEPEWVENDGKEDCPTPDGHDVEVQFRDESVERDESPERWPRWYHVGTGKDILYYRDWTQHKPPAPAVPEGWKLVPVEPTAEMLDAWFNAERGEYGENSDFDPAYRAMLKATPQPKGNEQ